MSKARRPLTQVQEWETYFPALTFVGLDGSPSSTLLAINCLQKVGIAFGLDFVAPEPENGEFSV